MPDDKIIHQREPTSYEVAEQQIRLGLSPTARIILGFFAIFFAIMMYTSAPPKGNLVLYAFATFSLLIGIACATKGRLRQFVGSIIGATLFVLSGCYFVYTFSHGPFISRVRGEPSVLSAIFFFVFFGLPGVMYAINVRFGFRKRSADSPPSG